MARQFFDARRAPTDDDGHPILAYNRPRTITGAAQRLNLSKAGAKLDKRQPQEWQIAAWKFFEAIGEIHYAFNLIGQVCSRVRLFPAVVAAPNEVPVHVDTWLESLGDKGNTDRSREVVDKAKELMDDLTENTPGRTSGMMRTMAMNFGIPGEVFLAQDREHHQWLVLSSEELTSHASKWRVRRSRAGRTPTKATDGDLMLPSDAWVARMWRTHPRWGDEPDSSMLGVLDQCEQLVLLDQAMRNMARRAMNAGVVFVPQGITAYSDNADDTVADVLAQAALQSIESEAALSTVTPKVLTGPLELGNGIKFIPLTQPTDPNLAAAAQKLLERILQGIDIPKDVVKGLADVKFANAIVIDDDLYRAHIEPLILLIVDTLTAVYLHPQLTKGLDEASTKIADRIVCWADTASIVTRPDKSQAANEGWDRHLLSGEAWRRARGFSETDAPDDEEIVRRVAMERAPISPEMGTVMVQALNPDFFDRAAKEGAEESGIPSDISELLTPPGPGQAPPEPSAMERGGGPLEGGEITSPGGNLPPAAARRGTP